MLPLILVIVVFVTVVMVGPRLRSGGRDSQFGSWGPSARAGRAAAGSRRTSLRSANAWSRRWIPISKAIPLSPADVSRTRAWLIQAGFRDAIDVNYYFGARILMSALGFIGVALFSGIRQSFPSGGVAGSGILSAALHSEADDSRTGSAAFASACPTRWT